MIQETFGWKSLSVIAGITLWNFYFQIHAGSIKSPQVIDFLKALLDSVPGKVFLIMDGHPVHKAKKVSEFVREKADGKYSEIV